MRCPNLSELPPPPPGRTGWPWTEENPQLPDTMPGGSPWPGFSIVTPCYNHAEFIEETIRSVLLQGYPAVEYIVIDGGSTDGSAEIIRKYEKWLAYWVSEPDEGQSHAINKGFSRAHNEVFAWLNSDDVYLPDTIQTAARFLAENPDVAMVYGGEDKVDNDGEFILRNKAIEFDLEALYRGNFIPQPSTFFKKEAFEDVGGLDTGLHYGMDMDLWVRLALKYEIRSIPRILAKTRMSPDIKTSSMSDDRWEETYKIGERYGIERFTDPEHVLLMKAKNRLKRGKMFYEAYRMKEAREDLLEAVKLNANYTLTLKAAVLFLTSFFGAGLMNRLLKSRREASRRN